MGLGDVSGLGQEEGHRVLGGRQDVGLRCVDDHDAPLGGRLDVDVVEADAGPAHDHEIGAGFEHLAGHLGGRPDDQRRGAGEHLHQLVGLQAEPDVHDVAGIAQVLEAAVGDLLGDEDPRHSGNTLVRALSRASVGGTHAIGFA